MSRSYPIISITGSSGAGTTSVKKTFENIFRRENVKAAYIEGDAFHRYNRFEMRARMQEEANHQASQRRYRFDRWWRGPHHLGSCWCQQCSLQVTRLYEQGQHGLRYHSSFEQPGTS